MPEILSAYRCCYPVLIHEELGVICAYYLHFASVIILNIYYYIWWNVPVLYKIQNNLRPPSLQNTTTIIFYFHFGQSTYKASPVNQLGSASMVGMPVVWCICQNYGRPCQPDNFATAMIDTSLTSKAILETQVVPPLRTPSTDAHPPLPEDAMALCRLSLVRPSSGQAGLHCTPG